MSLKAYFEEKKGIGVLSTASAEGKVNSAVYSRPQVMEDGTVAFIMTSRLSHENLVGNPHAAYLFKEEGPGYQGKRLALTKIRETDDAELIEPLRRRHYNQDEEEKIKPLHLVYFRVDAERPLVGG
jgi:hypothetical protein